MSTFHAVLTLWFGQPMSFGFGIYSSLEYRENFTGNWVNLLNNLIFER